MYSLNYSESAKKQFKKLPRDIQQRLLSALERIRIRPEIFVERLIGIPYYKFRVGDYRIILDIEQNKLLILIIKIGHRKNVYK